jgi:ATP/maltotriose-dependent transcriptional regulator MalT
VDRIDAYAADAATTFEDEPLIRLGAGSQQAFVALLRCEPGPAREAALRVDELPERLGGLPYQRHTLDWVLAIAALARGDLAGAERRAGAPWVGAGTEEAWTAGSWPRLALLARIDRLRGGPVTDVLRRFESRDRGSEFAAQHTTLVEHSVRAQVAWAAGDLRRAEEELRAGVEVQERIRLLPYVADLRLDLALVAHAAGRGGTAELERFLAAAESYDATGLLLTAGQEAVPLLRLARSRGVRREVVARALAAIDTDHRPEAITVPGTQQTLSSREVEVLRLIASGASNADIAEHLVISPNTVKTHIRKVLAKVGAANRAQAVVAARRLGVD